MNPDFRISMPTLLHIDSSPLGDTSVSRELSGFHAEQWLRANPGSHVIRRDLAKEKIPVIGEDWIHSTFVPEDSRNPAQNEILSLSDTFIAELEAADEYAIGLPMHNFTVGAALRLWIDQLVRIGKTFDYVDGQATGLLKGKSARFFIASGGTYPSGSDQALRDFAEPYLRTIFAYMGITDVYFFKAEGTVALRSGSIDRAAFLQPHFDAIRRRLAEAS